MTPQHIGPEQKKQLEVQLEKIQGAIKLKNVQIELKVERARLYDTLHVMTRDGEDTEGASETLWAQIYALDAATATNDAELLRMDRGEMDQAVTQLETLLKAVNSGLVVATAQMPRNVRNTRHKG